MFVDEKKKKIWKRKNFLHTCIMILLNGNSQKFICSPIFSFFRIFLDNALITGVD